MAVYKKKWYYESPTIQNGDTTVVRRNASNPSLTQRVYLRGPQSSVTTRYYDMNGGGGGYQSAPTVNPKQAIEETRQVILTTPKEQWEEKPFTFKNFVDAVKSFYNQVRH